MTTILVRAWGALCLVAASLCLWPWVERWFNLPGDDWRLVRGPMAVGLSLGGLTLWMLVAGSWSISVWVVFAFPLLAVIFPLSAQRSLSAIKIRHSVLSVFSVVSDFLIALRRGNTKSWLALAGPIALAVVLRQATYFPFIGDCEIGRYSYCARLILTRGHIGADIRG